MLAVVKKHAITSSEVVFNSFWTFVWMVGIQEWIENTSKSLWKSAFITLLVQNVTQHLELLLLFPFFVTFTSCIRNCPPLRRGNVFSVRTTQRFSVIPVCSPGRSFLFGNTSLKVNKTAPDGTRVIKLELIIFTRSHWFIRCGIGSNREFEFHWNVCFHSWHCGKVLCLTINWMSFVSMRATQERRSILFMKTLFTSSFMAAAFLLLSPVYCGLRKRRFLLNRDLLCIFYIMLGKLTALWRPT